MDDKIRYYKSGRAGVKAFAKCLTAILLLFFCLSANAQRDIFRWELSGSFGVVNSGEFELPEDPSLFAAGGRLKLNLGNAWQFGVHAGQFNFGEAADLERSYAGLSAAYYWDNGTLLSKRAFITPYHMVEGGLFGSAVVQDAVITEQASAVGLENGLKFRFGDRVTFHVAHAVYREVDSGGFEETVGNDGLSLWKAGLSYHFGARKVDYDGPVFDASARFYRSPRISGPISPVLSLPGFQAGESDSISSADFSLEPPSASETEMITGVDTIINYYVDTSYASSVDTLYFTVMDTSITTTVDTAFTFRVDSIRGNVLDTTYTQVRDTSITPRRDTAFVAVTDTMYTVQPDTVFNQWSRPAGVGSNADSASPAQSREQSMPSAVESDSLYIELRERITYLEGLTEGLSRRDTVIMFREQAAEPEQEKAEQQKPLQEKEQTSGLKKENLEKEEKQQKQKTAPADAESSTAPEENSPSTSYQTDPAILAIMERQEELMKTQNALLSELSAKKNEVTVTPQARERRIGISPTVAVPVGGGGNQADNDRIEKLEEEVASLRKLLEAKTSAPAADTLSAARMAALTSVPKPITQGATDSDSLANENIAVDSDSIVADTAAFDTNKSSISHADSTRMATDDIRRKADSISAAVAERKAKNDATKKSTEPAETNKPATAAPKAASKLKSSYPAIFKFGLNKDDVGIEYDAVFDKVAADLKGNPQMRARIAGFTDRSGNVEYNRRLSEKRALSVKKKLAQRGVSEEQLIISGEGESEGDDKWNPGDRRVEVTLTL